MGYLSAKEMKEKYKITTQTLNNWRRNGKVKYIELSSRKFMYEDVFTEKEQKERQCVIYTRVSNTKQKDDLIRQEKIIREFMVSTGVVPENVYSDIASGMNENRKGLNSLLKDIQDGKISKIYISYKDRLTRFGFGYFETFFEMFGVEIVVLNSSKEEDFQQELTEDLISIIHHFSMKMYSNRRKILKSTETLLKST